MKRYQGIIIGLGVVGAGWWWSQVGVKQSQEGINQGFEEGGEMAAEVQPLSVEYLKLQSFPGSDLVREQQLENGSNYGKYIVSYKSEGLKQYALLTVPIGEIPAGGWPALVFNHGYIPPLEYRTTERYADYQDLWWSRRRPMRPVAIPSPGQRGWWRQELVGQNEGAFGPSGEAGRVVPL